MRTLRGSILALVGSLFLALPGCLLTSGQVLISFDLPDPILVTSPTTLTEVDVDLNSIGDYADHKQDLATLADVAILGDVTNNASNSIDVEFWMTAGTTSLTTATAVRSQGQRLWGPFQVAAGATSRIDWDRSASLFDAAGRTALVAEVKGDGAFTIYALATSTTFDFSIANGALVLVLDAGI